jgi:hypothetical protein
VIYTNSSVVSAGLKGRHKVAELGTRGADRTCEQLRWSAPAPDDADGLSTPDAQSVRHGDRVVRAHDLPEVPRGSELVVGTPMWSMPSAIAKPADRGIRVDDCGHAGA